MSATLRRSASPYHAVIDADCAAAALLGETEGRTISRVIGGTISDATGLSEDVSTHVGHAVMVAAALVPQVRLPLTAVLAGAFFMGRR